MEMQHLCRADPGRSDTQVAARPRLQCDPGYARPRSCATWAALDLGRARTPVSGFFFFFFFFLSSLMNTYFLLLLSFLWVFLFCWYGFLLLLSLRICLFFNFSWKSSLRDSISMQMPREKIATSNVNNPLKSRPKNSIYGP